MRVLVRPEEVVETPDVEKDDANEAGQREERTSGAPMSAAWLPRSRIRCACVKSWSRIERR